MPEHISTKMATTLSVNYARANYSEVLCVIFYRFTITLDVVFTVLFHSIYLRLPPKKTAKTYNSGYSLVVTHLTTNPPVRCLNRAERTGSLVFNVLWSYV
jgi:hypothetical protein